MRMEENAKATMVVAMMARGLSSPTSSAMLFAMRWKKGLTELMSGGDSHSEDKCTTHNDLYHHTTVCAGETARPSRVDELRNYCPECIMCQWYPGGQKKGPYETKNIETPTPPRSAKTPEAGKMIIPSSSAKSVGRSRAHDLGRTRDAIQYVEQSSEYHRRY